MADIFLSYAREDRKKAERLAKALEGQGWSVFWDLTIPAGETWDTYIGGELEKARCVVVAWSKAAVNSEWVREEAREGRERKILVPAFFAKVKPPFGFRGIQGPDLTAWRSSAEQAPAFRALEKGIERLLGPAPLRAEVRRRPAAKRTASRKKSALRAKAAASVSFRPNRIVLIEGILESKHIVFNNPSDLMLEAEIVAGGRTLAAISFDRMSLHLPAGKLAQLRANLDPTKLPLGFRRGTLDYFCRIDAVPPVTVPMPIEIRSKTDVHAEPTPRRLQHAYGVARHGGSALVQFEAVVPKGSPYPTEKVHHIPSGEIEPDGWLTLEIYENSGSDNAIRGNNEVRRIGQIRLDTLEDDNPGCDILFLVDANRKLTVFADNHEVPIRPTALHR